MGGRVVILIQRSQSCWNGSLYKNLKTIKRKNSTKQVIEEISYLEDHPAQVSASCRWGRELPEWQLNFRLHCKS